MASRLRALRVLVPTGVLSGSAVAAWRATLPSEDTSEEGAPESEPVSTRLATQLEGKVPAVALRLLLLLLAGLPDKERAESESTASL